jgi:hypothetical protein
MNDSTVTAVTDDGWPDTDPHLGPGPTDRPAVTLVGIDGNAFMLLGVCRREQRRAGWTVEEMKAWSERANSAPDYDHLLMFLMLTMDVS